LQKSPPAELNQPDWEMAKPVSRNGKTGITQNGSRRMGGTNSAHPGNGIENTISGIIFYQEMNVIDRQKLIEDMPYTATDKQIKAFSSFFAFQGQSTGQTDGITSRERFAMVRVPQVNPVERESLALVSYVFE